MKIGYARVSTDGQSLEAQVAELKAAGCGKVFQEKVSGAKTDRAQLKKAIASLGSGDVLMVTRLDRLARSTRDLLNTLDAIAKVGAGFKSLRDAWADTMSDGDARHACVFRKAAQGRDRLRLDQQACDRSKEERAV